MRNIFIDDIFKRMQSHFSIAFILLATTTLVITLSSCSDNVILSERNNSKPNSFEVQISHNPVVGSKFCEDSINVEFKIPRTQSSYKLNLSYDNKIIKTKIIDKVFFRNQNEQDYRDSKWINLKIPAWNHLKRDSVAIELEIEKNQEIIYSYSSKIIYIGNNQSVSIARRKPEMVYAKKLRFNSGLLPKSKIGLYTTNLKGNFKVERFQDGYKVTDIFHGSKLYLGDKESPRRTVFAKTLNIPNFELFVSSEFNLRLENRDRNTLGSIEVTKENENHDFGYVYNKLFIGEQQTLKFNECERLVLTRDSIHIPFTYRITTMDNRRSE